jgi:hypothetical protein
MLRNVFCQTFFICFFPLKKNHLVVNRAEKMCCKPFVSWEQLDWENICTWKDLNSYPTLPSLTKVSIA